MDLLKLFLNKSFSKLGPNCTVSNGMVSEVLETAALTQDFLENTCKKMGNKPNADIIFNRIRNCDIEKLITTFLFILEFMIKQVKQKYNLREYTIAIDTHYEPFYGRYEDIWVYGYKPARGCNGSYKYITIAIVTSQARFNLLALPVHIGQDQAELVERLVKTAKKYIRVKLVLLDRGFYSGSIIKALNSLKVKYLLFVPENEANKKYLESMPDFSHKYFNHKIEWDEDQSIQRLKVKLLLIKDFVDMTSWKIYNWIFATNLTNTTTLTYVKLYKCRWGIETNYKLLGDIKIKTVSQNYLIRFFLFMIRILLYNLWKFYNIINQTTITFKQFTFMLFLSFIKINYIYDCKQKMKTFLQTTE